MPNQVLEQIVISGKSKEVIREIKSLLANGSSPAELINTMTSAIQIVGENFQNGEIQISDMLSSAMTMKKGISYITPIIKGQDAEYIGKVIVGMASGDLHDIGKDLVVLMLESVGFKVIDLGIDVEPQSFAETIMNNPDCKLMAISATLDSTIPQISNTIEYIKKQGLRDQVKIIVGGTFVTNQIAEKIGADAYAPTATLTAIIAKELNEK